METPPFVFDAAACALLTSFQSFLLMTFHLICFQEFTMHDTIGCYLDIDKGHVKFSKNGKNIYDSCF